MKSVREQNKICERTERGRSLREGRMRIKYLVGDVFGSGRCRSGCRVLCREPINLLQMNTLHWDLSRGYHITRYLTDTRD